ncbi:myb-like protein X isoform X2 [Phymastichus coffea]|uniref:myb-like protein X isoform X2 n=1 Tax=Phymastichus coffea TaxID=108790 RepID=UPI00273AE4D4|nr:myb-like protein X isoform X2 [Phymastichus coffea]
MPGIHVRSLGKLHWEDRDKEPTLTVPGSYWLCHKNNIYKFMFKFNKSTSSAENFPHSKELMKIIRRIIKWQPKQGQHFGTKHLLVTYNHASWTRQDKMFAKMKFCDRPDAIAFPHAFILTVKLLNQQVETIVNQKYEEAEEKNMGGTSAKTAPADLLMRTTTETAAINTIAVWQPPSGSSVQDESVADTTATMNGHRESVHKNYDSSISWSLRTRSQLKDSDGDGDGGSGSTDTTTMTVEPVAKKAATEKNVDDCNTDEVNSNISEKDMMDSDCGNELTKADDTAATLAERREKQEPIDNEDEDSNDSNDSQSDSASLPYQYLIERDIERELLNSRLSDKNESKENNAATANTHPSVKSCNSSICNDIDNSSKSSDSRKSNSKLRSRQESKDNDTAPPPEVANLKSSDITDLVMKGLMFTIRQDNDTVTVVEQKTKLEVDEVLENSEKVETKEGDQCLLNSSLLRLEKMVTRIQDPASLPAQKQNGTSENALISFVDLADKINIDNEKRLSEAESTKEKSENTDTMDTANCLSQFFNKNLSNSAFETFGKVWNDTDIYHTDEEYELKDEDIVPEALVDQVFFNDKLDSVNTSAVDNFEDLLMDDIEPFDDNIVNKGVVLKSDVCKSDSPVTLNGAGTKDTSKLPKVISNELITNDQIPAAILKSLKNNKSATQQVSQKTDNKNSDEINNVPQNNNKQSVQEKTVEIEAKIKPQSDTPINKELSSKVKNSVKVQCVEKSKKVMEYNVKVIIQRHEDGSNQENAIELSPNSIIEKRVIESEVISDKKICRSTTIKNSEVSNSSSSNNTRLTRSNSKILGKIDEKLLPEDMAKTKPILENSKSNKTKRLQTSKRSIETRAQKLTEKKLENQENKTMSQSSGLSRKRKRSINDQNTKALKFCKSVIVNGNERKDIKVKVWKLINDLQYGVRVSVERMDIKNIPR